MRTYVITEVGGAVLNLPVSQKIEVEDNIIPNPIFWVLMGDNEVYHGVATYVYETLMSIPGSRMLKTLSDLNHQTPMDTLRKQMLELILEIGDAWQEYWEEEDYPMKPTN